MKQKVAILGSTGSIGDTTLKLILKNKKLFTVELLSSNKNFKKLLSQAVRFKVKNVIIHNKDIFIKKSHFFKKKNINVFNNISDYKISKNKKFDYVMISIIGLDGLKPTLDIIQLTKRIAIANKESIICGWNLIKKELNKYNTEFIPVDSEHFSIHEIIKKDKKENIKKIYITASGGPFLKVKHNKLSNFTPKNAIKHPTWNMGKKISIDSATMINKVYELIEAKKIFDFEYSLFEILIQPTSYVHAIVEYNNGVTKLLTHKTSMKIPIFNSLIPNLNYFEKENFELGKMNNLDFQHVNNKNFPLKNIINLIPKKDSLFETVLISANDTLVEMFLNNLIKFHDIYKILLKILNSKEFTKYKTIRAKNIEQILKLNKIVRLKTQSLSVLSSF